MPIDLDLYMKICDEERGYYYEQINFFKSNK